MYFIYYSGAAAVKYPRTYMYIDGILKSASQLDVRPKGSACEGTGICMGCFTKEALFNGDAPWSARRFVHKLPVGSGRKISTLARPKYLVWSDASAWLNPLSTISSVCSMFLSCSIVLVVALQVEMP